MAYGIKPPASVDEVLPHVRPLARNKIGFNRDAAAAFEKARRTFTSEQGYMEATYHGFHAHTCDHFYPLTSGHRPSGPKATEH